MSWEGTRMEEKIPRMLRLDEVAELGGSCFDFDLLAGVD